MAEPLQEWHADRWAALRSSQRKRWRLGNPVTVEELLGGESVVGMDERSILDLLYSEIRLSAEAGEQPTVAAYRARFPQLADQLGLLFEVHEAIAGLERARTWETTELGSVSQLQRAQASAVAARLLEGFERRWHEGTPPSLEEFSTVRGLDGYSRRKLLEELVALDMDHRWRQAARQTGGGEAGPLLDAYLPRFPELGPPEQPAIQLVVDEYRVRSRYASRVDVHEYGVRFPGYGAGLVDLLSALERTGSQQALSETSESWSNPAEETSREGATGSIDSAARPTLAVGHDPDAPLPYSDFRFQEKIGSGGMGTVYRALQVSLGKPVAVKVLKKDRVERPTAIERFLREGRSVARLNHPHIVDVHGIGRTPDGGYFMVMDLVEGRDLEQMIRAKAVSLKDVFLVVTIAAAIHHAHQKGVIHRDLKPSNILVDGEGRVLVSDFGLAKFVRGGDPALSVTNAPLGTPSYMAPEQASHKWGEVGPRTDVYGLGGILYSVLTCRPPYTGDSYTEVLAQVVSQDAPTSPRQLQPEVPPELESICLSCLAKRPPDRYATAHEVAEALLRWAAAAGIEPGTEGLSSGQVRLAELARSSALTIGSGSRSTFDPSKSTGPPRGAMPLDSEFYVGRSADQEFQSALARCDSIILIRGARQMGKTSLLARGLMRVRDDGCQVALSDFQKLRSEELQTPDGLFHTIADWMVDELDLDLDVDEIWDARRSASVNFERFIRRGVLRQSEARLVWGLDEVDRLFECPFHSEVFGLFRSWHNGRALQPAGPWSRLTLAMAYATEAHLFISDPNQSPFNVGTLIALDDFSREQIAALNSRYGDPLTDDRELDRFQGLVGGHPYLANRGLYEMAARSMPVDDFVEQAGREAGFFGDHLRRLLALLNQEPQLRDVFREMLAGAACTSVESFYRLRSAGLIAGDSAASALPRCQLYQLFFQRHLS